MTPERCEPPPELRGVDGWHWVSIEKRDAVAVFWCHRIWFYTGGPFRPEWCAANHWRYLSPVSTPAEVEALRLEVLDMHDRIANMARDLRIAEEASVAARRQWAEVGIHPEEVRRLRMENATLRAALSAETP